MAVRRPLIAGNWKMNGLQSDGLLLARGIAALNLGGRDVLVCPPFTLITSVCAAVAGSAVLVAPALAFYGRAIRHHGREPELGDVLPAPVD